MHLLKKMTGYTFITKHKVSDKKLSSASLCTWTDLKNTDA